MLQAEEEIGYKLSLELLMFIILKLQNVSMHQAPN
jgi:hypothetical protein